MKILIAINSLQGIPSYEIFDLINKIYGNAHPIRFLIISNNKNVNRTNLSGFIQDSIDFDIILLDAPVNEGRLRKMAIKYCLNGGFDFFTSVNPEDLLILKNQFENLLQPLIQDKALVVFGSRSKKIKLGLIHFFQKKFFGKYLEDYFTPYIFFSTKIFQKIPYLYNSDDSRFNIEIPIQVFYSQVIFKEVLLDDARESNQSNNLTIRMQPYLRIFFKAFLHSLGIYYQKKFDCVYENQHYNLKIGYASSHTYVINAINDGSKVIDIGAGPFGISKFLVRKNCTVVTVDMFDIPEEFKIQSHIISDLNKNFAVPLLEYDYILFLDIIEHLLNPEEFLLKVSDQFTNDKKKVIFTTGNIAFFPLRLNLLFGFFNYGKSGILDITHTRLFTFKSFIKLLTDANFKITKVKGVPAPFPKSIGENYISRMLIHINLFLIRISKTMFSYQIYIEAETTPSIDFLIGRRRIKKNIPDG